MRAPIAENAMEVVQMDEFEGNGLYWHRVSCNELAVSTFCLYGYNIVSVLFKFGSVMTQKEKNDEQER